ncbi:MAG: aminoglycoside phosphotransferase family protein [Clostridiales bacterium]|nr:aminoglycoside phosphotransferase family protein [Clostridiales bacterium]MDD7035623.1 aminoglycoside phosphotransferase family protein [Bacillota bacterium]MDY2920226.1 aminoglycoside phosphotransferase family protein [Lentihominibacter sp.]
MKHGDILEMFLLDSPATDCREFGNGNINSTFLVTTESGSRYILQRVSEEAFKDVPALMENIEGVTDFLSAKAADEGTAPHVLAPLKTRNGSTWVKKDGYFRVTPFAENSISLEAPESDEDFRECARAFGTFISELAEYPAATLHETIPNFHNTPDRFRLLHEAMERAKANPELAPRLDEAADELKFALDREEEAGTLQKMRDDGTLPERVTHNDTKLNNVLLNADTRKLMYVIDLDTVMPGLSLYDYGDCLRFGASTAAEDEKDLSKVSFDLHMFRVFTEGFVEACENLTAEEKRMLPAGPKTLALELGVRFLTDYLDGDRYFLTKYPGHNLVRCRTQLKLVEDMESKWEKMNEIVKEITE